MQREGLTGLCGSTVVGVHGSELCCARRRGAHKPPTASTTGTARCRFLEIRTGVHIRAEIAERDVRGETPRTYGSARGPPLGPSKTSCGPEQVLEESRSFCALPLSWYWRFTCSIAAAHGSTQSILFGNIRRVAVFLDNSLFQLPDHLEVIMARRLKGRLVVVLGLVMAAIFIGAPSASAATYFSPFNYYSTFGYNYWNQSAVVSDYPYRGTGYAGKNGTGTVPGAYMGIQMTLYKNGAYCRGASMYYSTSAASSIYINTASGSCGTGVYNAKGSSAAYNGNGYNFYYTAASPSFNGS